MRTLTLRILRSAAAAGFVLMMSVTVLAHDHGGEPDPKLAESVAPGVTALGLLVVAAIATGVWLHLRRVAMMRALKIEAATAAKAASSERDAQS